MQIAVTDVLARALRLCGQSQAPGRGQSTEEVAEGVGFLNQTIDGWNAMEQNIYAQNVDRYTLVPNQQEYTIGPSGADFTAPRPTYIRNANIIQNTADPEVRIPLTILDDNQWASISVRDYATSVPTYLYYNRDANVTYGTIYLVGYPNNTYELELYTWGSLDSALTSASNLIVPEGYLDALVYTLAERMFPLYARKANIGLLPEIKEQARKARAAIVSLNSQAPKQGSDAPSSVSPLTSRGPYYNYLTGDARSRR